MSFLDCINTAAQTGRITANQSEKAAEAYRAAIDEGIRDGLSESAAEADAARRATEAVGTKTKQARRIKMHTMRKEYEIYKMIHESDNPLNQLAGHSVVAPINTLTAQIEATHDAVQSQLLASMNHIAQQFKSKFLGLVKPLQNMDDIAHGVYGRDVSPAAKLLAEQYVATQELERKLLNLEGANIPENPNRRMTQVHDRLAVRNAGRDAWVNDHLKDEVLDWDLMRNYDGEEIPVDDRRGILEKVWEAIVTNGKSQLNEAFGGESFMQRIQRERFLYYKTSDSWLEMNKKYGRGNAYNQLLDSVKATARYVSVLRHLGPVPENGITFASRTLQKLNAQKNLNAGVRTAKKAMTQLERELGSFKQQTDILMGKVDNGAGDALVQTVNSARSIVGTSYLGGMMITSLSDPFYAMWMRQVNGLPFVKTIPRYINDLLHLKNFKREAVNSGFGLESVVRDMHSSQRFTLDEDISAFAHTVSEFNMRATGMSTLDDITHARAGFDVADALAKYRNENFDDVPFVTLMRNLGITEKDWSLLKDAPLYTPEYYDGRISFGNADLLRPIDLWGGNAAQREAANKFMMMQEIIAKGSRPIRTVRTAALLGGATSARSVAGQATRMLAQFMVSPASILYTHWRVAMQAPRMWGLNGKFARFTTLMLYTTAAGAMIQQIKEMLKNRTPADMTTPQFWIKSMVIGGAGAILGDFIYNNITATDGPFSGSTPTAQTAKKLYAAFAEPVKWAMGDDTAHPARAEMEAAWSLLPKPQPVRYFVEHMLYDHALEAVDPAAWERKRSKELEVLGQTGQQELYAFEQ